MKALYLALSAKLKELGCVFVDRWNRQPEDDSNTHPFDMPAGFVELRVTDTEPGFGDQVKKMVDVTVYVVQTHLGDSHNTGDVQRTDSLETLDVTDAIAKGLHMFNPLEQFPLELKSQMPDHNYQNYRVDVLTFRTALYEAC